MEAKSVPHPQVPKQQTNRHRHLRPGLAALLLFLALMIAARMVLGAAASRYLYTLAPMVEDQTVKGVSLSREAARHKDMLILLGSSELTFQDEFHPAKIFDSQPTGFSVYLIGSGYRQSIHNLLALSALGSDIKGKRVVLFVTPTWFNGSISDTAYRKNFSPVQAYELVYTSPLSPALKQRAAHRLLALGSPGTDDPVLRAGLQSLAAGGLWGKTGYCALWPLGRLRLETLRIHDDMAVLKLVWQRGLKPRTRPVVHNPPPDWGQLLTAADIQAMQRSTTNQFGIQDNYYTRFVAPRLEQLRNSATGDSWRNSSEYADLDLVIATLKELHVRPLVISLPVMGAYYDFRGHPAADRQAYYARIRALGQRDGVQVVDFGSQEYEMGFMRDPWHPGWKGAVQIAQAVDQFYHSADTIAPR
ncbi:MAG: alanine transporter [Firmicutes bacterium]|nr:alanine transporter [Bacillota bacterium]